MRNIKEELAILSALCIALWTTQTTFAWYDPSSGRWLARDPVGEPGFRALNAPVYSIGATPSAASPARWIKRYPILSGSSPSAGSPLSGATRSGGNNLYAFVRNDPVNYLDVLGLARCPCTKAAPVPDSSPLCDAYGDATYPGGINLKCFCKCAGNSAWSKQVRGCLACEFADGTDVVTAHKRCYAAAGGITSGPIGTLAYCFEKCSPNPPVWETGPGPVP